MKIQCSQCEERKSPKHFRVSSASKTGHEPECKDCQTMHYNGKDVALDMLKLNKLWK